MKWLALVVLWAAAGCGESVIVARELVSDAGAPPQSSCGESIRAEPAPAVIELVVDSSGTMDNDLPGGRGTKWTVTRDALLESISALPEQTSLGVVFYPDVPSSAPTCFDRNADVTIDALGTADSEQRTRIRDAFREQTPEGAAPVHDAYFLASQQLSSSQAPGRRFVVLIADNAPTHGLDCRNEDRDPGPLIAASSAALRNGVRTFVLGLPIGAQDQGARRFMSEMAAAGGTGFFGCSHDGPRFCHFDLTNPQEFPDAIERALHDISANAICSFAPPAVMGAMPPDPEQLVVRLTLEDGPSQALDHNTAGPCNEGWQYSPDGSLVVLCQRTCEQLRERNGSIELQSSCGAQSR